MKIQTWILKDSQNSKRSFLIQVETTEKLDVKSLKYACKALLIATEAKLDLEYKDPNMTQKLMRTSEIIYVPKDDHEKKVLALFLGPIRN